MNRSIKLVFGTVAAIIGVVFMKTKVIPARKDKRNKQKFQKAPEM